MIYYYSICAILSIFWMFMFLSRFEGKKINYYFTIFSLLISIASLGYVCLINSSNVTEGILANKIIYLGGCFAPLVLLFAICSICNFKVNRWIRILLLGFNFFVYGLVCTIGYSEIYYKDVSLVDMGNYSVLEYSYGFGHNFFYVLLYGYIVVELVILIYSLINKHTVSRKSITVLILVQIINVILFVVSRVFDFPFEIMPFVYIFDCSLLFYLHRRISMYNIEDCVNNSLQNQDTYGYIVFDTHLNYVGCNQIIPKIIPEIEKCKVDSKVDNIPSMTVFLQWIKEYDNALLNNQTPMENDYEVNDEHYLCSVERIWHKENPCGYIIEMRENTVNWNYVNLMSSYNEKLENQIREKMQHIQSIQSQILSGMASIVENRDDNTGGHVKRTSDVIRILIDVIKDSKILDLSDQFCEDLIKAAPMHDLGKVGVDDKVLRKPGRLTEEEFAIMQTHVIKSANLVDNILQGVEEEHFIRVARNVAKYHHEKWNGRGYPENLKEEQIPLEARIMAIADVYDALVSKRCYKESMSFEEAESVMLESMGSHFDPGLKQVFVLSKSRLEEYYKQA